LESEALAPKKASLKPTVPSFAISLPILSTVKALNTLLFRAPLKTLIAHNGLKRSEICKEIFKSLAVAKLRKYLCKDCFFLAHPSGIASFALCCVVYF